MLFSESSVERTILLGYRTASLGEPFPTFRMNDSSSDEGSFPRRRIPQPHCYEKLKTRIFIQILSFANGVIIYGRTLANRIVGKLCEKAVETSFKDEVRKMSVRISGLWVKERTGNLSDTTQGYQPLHYLVLLSYCFLRNDLD